MTVVVGDGFFARVLVEEKACPMLHLFNHMIAKYKMLWISIFELSKKGVGETAPPSMTVIPF
jgi:hypothetical protein